MMRDPVASPNGASPPPGAELPELLPEFDPDLELWGRPEPARWA